jgi:hypothetical protein
MDINIITCIALGWRFVDWPLPIAATRTATRISNRTGGSRDQRNHWEGTRAQGSSSRYKGLQPFSLEGQVRRYSEQPFPLHYPPPPPTHLWAVWAGTNYPPSMGSLGKNQLPPSTEPPPSPGNCHLELASVKASFWPLNLGQKSWFGHKMTE